MVRSACIQYRTRCWYIRDVTADVLTLVRFGDDGQVLQTAAPASAVRAYDGGYEPTTIPLANLELHAGTDGSVAGEGPILLALRYRDHGDTLSAQNAVQGALAERRVAEDLWNLRSAGWRIEYSVYYRNAYTTGHGDVDIFLTAPSGQPFVIDVKSADGSITYSAHKDMIVFEDAVKHFGFRHDTGYYDGERYRNPRRDVLQELEIAKSLQNGTSAGLGARRR